MKKLLLATVATLSIATAADHNLYPNSYYMFMSYNTFSADSDLVGGSYSYDIRFNQNNIQFENFSIDTLQYVMEYTPSAKYSSGEETSFFKGGANLLWYLDNPSPFTLYLLGGVGLKYTNNPKGVQTSMAPYTNVAAGLEYNIRNDIAIVGEKKFTYESTSKKEYTTSLGFRYSF